MSAYDVGEAFDDLEPGDRSPTRFELGRDLKALEAAGFVVYGSRAPRLMLEEVGEIRELLRWPTRKSFVFVKLRKSKDGRARILKLLGSSFATADHVKAMGIHKPFMVLTKIVDILIEPVAYRDGVDLYQDGAHLATSNLLHITIRARLGDEAYTDLLQRFVAMMRSGGIREIRLL